MGVPRELPILNSSTMQGERGRNVFQLRSEPTVCSPSSVIELAIRPAITPFDGDQFQTSARFDAHFRSPSRPDRSSAIHRVDSCSSQTASKAMTIGTPMKAPETPQRKLQKNTANRTMNGEMDRAAPAIRGSR